MRASVYALETFSSLIYKLTRFELSYLHKLQHEVELRLRALRILARGFIPIELFPPLKLNKAITTANNQLSTHRSEVEIYQDVLHYYDLKCTTTLRHNGMIYINIMFPIIVIGDLFEIYLIDSFRIPIDHDFTTNSSTKILDLPHMIGFSKNMDKVIFLEEKELHRCSKSDSLLLCDHRLAIYNTNPMTTCTTALFFDIQNKITELCNFVFFPYKGPDLQVTKLSTGSYGICTSSDDWTLTCDDSPHNRHIKPCGICTVTLPCNCILEISGWKIFSTNINCINSLHTKLDRFLGFNLEFLKITHPNLIETNWNSKTIITNTFDLNLDDKLIKPDDMDWETLTKINIPFDEIDLDMETLRTNDSGNFFDKPIWKWTITLIILLSIVVVTIVVLLWYIIKKYQKWRGLIPYLTSLFIPTVKTLEIRLPTIEKEKPQVMTCSLEYTDYMIYTISIVISILLLSWLWISFRNWWRQRGEPFTKFDHKGDLLELSKSISSTVFIELFSKSTYIVLKVVSYPWIYDRLRIEYDPLTIKTSIQKGYEPSLMILWGNTKMFLDGIDIEAPLPDRVPLSRKLSKLIKSLVNSDETTYTRLMLLTDNLIHQDRVRIICARTEC